MDRPRLLRNMRHAVEQGTHMLGLAGLAPRWRIAWGSNKTSAVSTVYLARELRVSRHFIPLVEPEELRAMLACAIFRICGRVTSWPTDTECIERISRALAPGVQRCVEHVCACGFTSLTAHALSRPMLATQCLRCAGPVQAFRVRRTSEGRCC